MYCLYDKRETENVPGSEKTEKTKNGRLRISAICNICERKMSQFISQFGGTTFAAEIDDSLG